MNTLEIRTALIRLAERMNRPYYEATVVRDVVNAFKNDTHHVLKDLIESARLVYVKPVDDSHAKQLKDFCAPFGMVTVLAQVSGMNYRQISKLINKKSKMSSEQWRLLSSSFARAETAYSRQGRSLKSDTHGTVNRYNEGCRCVECSGAVQIKNMVKKWVDVA